MAYLSVFNDVSFSVIRSYGSILCCLFCFDIEKHLEAGKIIRIDRILALLAGCGGMNV